MSKKHFSWLLVLTLLVAAVLMLLPGKTGKESTFEVRPLVPGLSGRVNEVSRVRIVKAGNQPVATLLRSDQVWVVEDAQSYPADWKRLKTLLAALAQAQVIEAKTNNPAYFGQLGLQDVTDDASGAFEVEIGEGDEAINLLVGRVAQGREGQYVRFANEEQALLIDRPVEVAGETPDWLEREIIDLADAEVVEVTLTHTDGEQVSVRKTSADDPDFSLQNIPAGRQIQSSWSVNALGGSLADLRLDEVSPDSELDWSQATHIRVLTADGLEIMAEVATLEGTAWLRLNASAYRPESALTEEAGGEQVVNETESSMDLALAQRVQVINRRVSGWAYAIPEYKSQVLTKKLEDLLAPPAAD